MTSFGVIDELLLMAAEKCIGDVLVNKGAEAPKPHLPPMEMRMLSSAADGLLPADTASTAIRAIFPPPLFSWSLGEKVKERTDQTNFNQLAPPSWRKVIQTKPRQTLGFDRGGYLGRLRGCPFLGGQRALPCGEVRLDAGMVSEGEAFLVLGGLEHHFPERITSDLERRTL